MRDLARCDLFHTSSFPSRGYTSHHRMSCAWSCGKRCVVATSTAVFLATARAACCAWRISTWSTRALPLPHSLSHFRFLLFRLKQYSCVLAQSPSLPPATWPVPCECHLVPRTFSFFKFLFRHSATSIMFNGTCHDELSRGRWTRHVRRLPVRAANPVWLALLLTPQHSPFDLTLHGQSLRTLQGQTATPFTASRQVPPQPHPRVPKESTRPTFEVVHR